MKLGRLRELRSLLSCAARASGDAVGVGQSSASDDWRSWVDAAALARKRGYARIAIRLLEVVCRDCPERTEPLLALAGIHLEGGRIGEAQACVDAAARLDTGSSAVYVRIAQVLIAQGRYAIGLLNLDRALAVNPRDAHAHFVLGEFLHQKGDYAQAVTAFETCYRISPEYPRVLGALLMAKAFCGDWSDFGLLLARLQCGIQEGREVASPLECISLVNDPRLQQLAIANWVGSRAWRRRSPRLRARDKTRLRLAYISPDFREHPVSTLLTEIVRGHDRRRFEVIAVSLNPFGDDAVTDGLRELFDEFHDVSHLPDSEVVWLCRSMHLDVAIDLAGYTRGARPALFAARLAPVQVSYLGFLGTSASSSMDYLIADAQMVTAASRPWFSESIVYLPSYQPARVRSSSVSREEARRDLGIEMGTFVFCCMNNSFKVLPEIFGCWVRILKAVPGSVLLLYGDNTEFRANLLGEARQAGLPSERIVMCEQVGYDRYLGRMSASDLFLDTHTYGAGTTAGDALWMGVPVITWRGESLASRVAAGVLIAAGLRCCVHDDADAYVNQAVGLARDPAKLDALRSKLAHSRSSAPLFDAVMHVRHLEAAYEQIHARACAGELPSDVSIDAAENWTASSGSRIQAGH